MDASPVKSENGSSNGNGHVVVAEENGTNKLQFTEEEKEQGNFKKF